MASMERWQTISLNPCLFRNNVESMLKDSYIFDMLIFTEQYDERDVQIGFVKHVEMSISTASESFPESLTKFQATYLHSSDI